MSLMVVDPGNDRTKSCGLHNVDSYCSYLGEWQELTGEKRSYGSDDMEWEYGGQKGRAGTIAKYECEFGGTIKGDSKAHKDTLIRVLLALHRNSPLSHVSLVVGQPISTHRADEKQKIIDMLKGEHEITVNNRTRTFFIEDVKVAVEGAAAYMCQPLKGTVRIIDIGSGTVNFATMHDHTFISRDSWTEGYGLETLNQRDFEGLARKIEISALRKWNREDLTYLVGGGAEEVFEPLVKRLPNVEVLYPEYKGIRYSPQFANVIGFRKIGELVYGY